MVGVLDKLPEGDSGTDVRSVYLETFASEWTSRLSTLSTDLMALATKFPVTKAPDEFVQPIEVELKALTDKFTTTCTTLQNYAPVMFRRHLSHHLECALHELDTELSSVLQQGNAVNTATETDPENYKVCVHDVREGGLEQRLAAAGEVLCQSKTLHISILNEFATRYGTV
eukprot:6334-Heterococcus_DN1.PRE.5